MGQKKAININKKPVIWWIDDDFHEDQDNTLLLNQLKKSRRYIIKGIVPQEFRKSFEKEKDFPDLFLVDYMLNQKSGENEDPYPYQGTSLVGVIRDRCPEHPIYLVSKLLDEENTRLTHERDDLFDRLIPHKWVSGENQSIIKDIFEYDSLDYRLLRCSKNRKNIKSIHELLKTPTSSISLIDDVLPKSFLDGIGKPVSLNDSRIITYNLSGPIWFSEWVRTELFRLQGLLYDALFAATFLGLEENYFREIFHKKIKRKTGIEYQGIFNKTHARRWWKLGLQEFIVEKNTKNILAEPWELTHHIYKIDKKYHSKCIICDENNPETVGYDKDDDMVRGPVHWRCSESAQERMIHPLYEQSRVFELD